MPFLAPLAAAFTAFAGTWFGSLVISIGVSVASSLLGSLLKQNEAPQRPPGFQLDVAMGDDNPLSFPIGTAATAGTRKYIGTWGQSGGVPNAYLTEVRQLSDIPGIGLGGFWANRQKCTILWGDTPVAAGYPVLEFRVGGVDHMWVTFRDGTEVTASAFMLAQFGGRAEYPWLATMIGRGTPHAIVTTKVNRELFTQAPTFLFEPTRMKFYDLRKDSTNGGSGAHRWNDQSTWEATNNPVVMIYNIVRGVYYGSTWIYGGRNLAAFRLPSSIWRAAANECDIPIALAAGGTEPQFRAGMQINVDSEPLAVIEDLLKSCNGRMSEIGGSFEIMVGTPGAAVYAFTDDDIVVTRKQGYRSFPSLNDSYNAIEAQYPEQAEMWTLKSAPARYNATWEAEDGGRRLATGLTFNTVPFAVQVQRLMTALIADNRRWRTHVLALPPDAWVLTGTCVVSWTSARNGYVNKKFLVTRIEGETGMIQPVILREIDPSDYSWSSGFELANPIGELIIERPEPQTPTGFQALPAIFYDSASNARRPSIEIVYDGNMPDIRAVHVLVRLKSSGAYVYDGEIPFAVPYRNTLNAVFLPATLYEAAIAYVAFSGRVMYFTAYQDVLTDDVRFGSADIDIAEIVAEVEASIVDLDEFTRYSVRELLETQRQTIQLAVSGQLDDFTDRQLIQRSLVSETNTSKAKFTEDILVATGPSSALALSITELTATVFDPVSGLPATAAATTSLSAEVSVIDGIVSAQSTLIDQLNIQVDDVSAEGLLAIQVGTTPVGVLSRIVLSSRATLGGDTAAAAMMLDAKLIGPNLTSEILLVGGRISLVASTDPSATKRGLLVVDGDFVYIDNARIRELTASNILAGSITSTEINVVQLVASSAFVTNLVVGTANITNLSVDRTKVANGAFSDTYASSGGATSGGGNSNAFINSPDFVGSGQMANLSAGINALFGTSGSAPDPGLAVQLYNVSTGAAEILYQSGASSHLLNVAASRVLTNGQTYRVRINLTTGTTGSYSVTSTNFAIIAFRK